MQNKMNDIELLIKRFIRKEISKLKPRDNDYAIQFLNDEFSKLMKCITKDKVMEGLYHKYRLGFERMFK
jgi:succinate dehydrogenase flavin-adding protein (antitoxin of CptAB toxin-antitoxin module)